MKQFAALLLVLFLAACSRPSLAGRYQTVGSEEKFQMALDLGADGQAAFSTRTNLGNVDLDKAVQATMSLRNGRWTQDGKNLIVTGTQGDGKPATYKFMVQDNGELRWERNGARFVKAK